MSRRGRGAARGSLRGLAGAVLLAAGCFAPIAALPGGGDGSLLDGDSIAARLLMVTALASAALVLLRRRLLLLTGAVAALLVLAEFFARRDGLVPLTTGASADPLLASAAHEWGWALLAGGVALLLLGGLSSRPRRRLAKFN